MAAGAAPDKPRGTTIARETTNFACSMQRGRARARRSSGELVEGGLRHGWMASLAGAAGTPAVVRRDALAALHGRSLVQAQCEAAHGADTGPLTRSKAEQNQAGRQPAWGKVLRGCLVCFNSTSIRSFLKL